VLATGGPQPESTIEFSIANHSVAVISQNGVIDARAIGQTMIDAKAVGFDMRSQPIIYSEVAAVYFCCL